MNSNSLVSAMDKLFVIPYRRKLFEVMNEKQITGRCHCKSTVSFNVQDVTRTLPLWDGPLEKWCVAAGGKWDFFSFQGFFFYVHCLCRIFFLGQVPCMNVFLGGEGCVEIFYCCNLNLDSRYSLIAWSRFQTIIFLSFTQGQECQHQTPDEI